MTRYACPNPACPRREPVTADAPPSCYTCGGKMAVAVVTGVPERLHEDDFTTAAKAWSDSNDHIAPLAYSSADDDGLTAALTMAIERDAAVPWGGPAIIGFETTPEQRARRELGPMTVTVTPPTTEELLRGAIMHALADNSADTMTPEQAAAEIARPSPVPSLSISLHARLPGERGLHLGPELSYPGYCRKRVDRGADGMWPERITIDFAQGTTSAPVEAWIFGINHGETGELLYYDAIHPRVSIGIGVTPTLVLPIRAITMLGAGARRTIDLGCNLSMPEEFNGTRWVRVNKTAEKA